MRVQVCFRFSLAVRLRVHVHVRVHVRVCCAYKCVCACVYAHASLCVCMCADAFCAEPSPLLPAAAWLGRLSVAPPFAAATVLFPLLSLPT